VKQMRPKDKRRMQNELAVLRTAPSRFIEHCHAAFESATDVFFVCDYIAGGDLFNHMVRHLKADKQAFTEPECRVLLAEMTLGLQHLHARGFIHRDLKLENIMIDGSGHAKIIDFGLACLITGDVEQNLSPTGSLSYMPPEMLKGARTGGRHTDWWAMGIIAYEMMAARSPWSTLTDRAVIKHEIENCRVVLPPGLVSKEANGLVENLLERNALFRLGTARDGDVQLAPFFRPIDWQAMERGETAPAFTVRECGPAVVDQAEGNKALSTYLEKSAVDLAAASSYSEVGQFGVRSPWFLGVDVVTSHPGLPNLLL